MLRKSAEPNKKRLSFGESLEVIDPGLEYHPLNRGAEHNKKDSPIKRAFLVIDPGLEPGTH